MEQRQRIIEAADRTIWACRHNRLDASYEATEHASIPHLEFMLLQMRKHTDIGKLNRWLGYMQGVAVALYGVELDTVRTINAECLYE